MFVDDNKPTNVVVPSDVSDCLPEKEIIDRSIEAATVYENDELASIEAT